MKMNPWGSALKIIGRVLKWTGVLLAVAICAAVVNQRIGVIRDARFAPPKDEMFLVHGRMTHLACLGHGARTYVLDAGLSAWSVFWWRIQPVLAAGARVCAVDRPGLGWSQSTNESHDGVSAADRLHDLLRTAGVSTPLVYVGHSLGANFAEIYQHRYPQDVEALVLIEPGDPKDMLEDFRGTRADAMSAPERGLTWWIGTAAGEVGLLRLLAHGRSFDGAAKDQYRAGAARTEYPQTIALELAAVHKTAFQDLDVASFGATPVLVFASSDPRKPDRDETQDQVRRWRTGQRAYLASLSAKSSRGAGLVIAPHSDHVSLALGAEPAAFLAQRIRAFAATLPAPHAGTPPPPR